MRKFRTGLTLLLASCAAMPALADETCPPLTILTSVDMQIGNNGLIYVPAKINNAPQNMLLDTGGFFTAITQPVADSLGLSTRHTGLELVGAGGMTTRLATRAAFTMGNLHSDGMDFMVLPDGKGFSSDVANIGGILSPNLLVSYDLELDFAGKKVNLLSQKHCEGKVVHWPADTVAVVPIEISRDNHIQVPVELDGHRFTAMLDTGASHTTLNVETAKRDFSLTLGSPETPVTGHLMSETGPDTWSHRFESLSLEGIAIAHPNISLIPDLMHNKMTDPADTVSNDTRIRDTRRDTGLPDMILGMDVLHRLHVYVAYKENKLYVTPAAPSAPAAAH